MADTYGSFRINFLLKSRIEEGVLFWLKKDCGENLADIIFAIVKYLKKLQSRFLCILRGSRKDNPSRLSGQVGGE